ncbi:MAG: asparagine synthase (glutamine-hydrolyzing) [Proteobacteria bacterium]|nr:asparagine synthase (glutamine-hydrolyzing) [Pseudomonadota bacterium]
MCGLAGYVGKLHFGLLDQMMQIIRPRGPDGEERFEDGLVHLGFARLAINDLSPTGNQPMASSDGRYITMVNGEIYNAAELRKLLEAEGCRFKGSSDAEVIPHGFMHWGTDLFGKLRGMFAVVVFDTNLKQLILARDHFGIKPLYFSTFAGGITFSSSARAVAIHPKVGMNLRESAIGELLRFRYCPSGESMFSRVETVNPGEWIVWDEKKINRRLYWHRQSYNNEVNVSREDWIAQFSTALENSVNVGMMSDVPMGILLSGGIDSGAVARFAGAKNSGSLLAFTYSMPGKHDESAIAKSISTSSGIEHRVIYSPNVTFCESYVRAIRAMDSPVADAIIVPTYNLLHSVSLERKVVLTGEGADELLGGYAHVGPLLKLGKFARARIPLAVVARLLSLVPTTALTKFFPYEAELGVRGHRKICQIVREGCNPALALDHATSIFTSAEVRSGTSLGNVGDVAEVSELKLGDLIDWGYSRWLPNQILNKMDQLSMAHGVEARVPYVDPVLYDVVRSIPTELIRSKKSNKIVLRNALKLQGYQWADEPKRAFFVPPTQTHMAELDALAKEWLCESMLNKHGIVSKTMAIDAITGMRNGDFLALKQVATLAGLHIWLDQERFP